MNVFLATDVVVLLLDFLSILFNIIILFTLSTMKKDYISLRLVTFLTIADFIHAVAISFYAIYLTSMWNPIQIDMNPYIVMISGLPLVIQLKINLSITVAVALDRVLALYIPLRYRMMSQKKFTTTAFVIALVLGVCDAVLEFWLSSCKAKVNCAAIGCFVSSRFRHYWGTSNMILGLIVIVLSGFVLIKLQQLKLRSRKSRMMPMYEGSKFRQANRSSASFVLCSLVCITIPSAIVGGAELLGFSSFEYIGPFYLVGLLSATCLNCVVHAFFNTELRSRLKAHVSKLRSGGWTSFARRRTELGMKSVSNASRLHSEVSRH